MHLRSCIALLFADTADAVPPERVERLKTLHQHVNVSAAGVLYALPEHPDQAIAASICGRVNVMFDICRTGAGVSPRFCTICEPSSLSV